MPFPFRGQVWPLGLALCFVGCGGHSSTKPASAISTTVAPVTSTQAPFRLVSSTPASGDLEVLPGAPALLEFDAPIDPASVDSSVVGESLGLQIPLAAVASGNVLELRPLGEWPSGQEITLTVTPHLRSQSGAPARVARVEFKTWVGRRPARSLALAEARSRQATVRLQDGRILSCGGLGAAPSGVAEVFDPELASLAPVGSLSTPRFGHSATRLQDGRVLVAGGQGVDALRSLELYDPIQGQWRALRAQLQRARQDHQAFLLPSGRVAFVGGWDGPPDAGGRALTTIELFDPADESVRLYLGAAVAHGEWAQLRGGRLLSLADGELLDLERGSRTPGQGTLGTPRRELGICRLADGGVLVAGGSSQDGSVLHDEVERFDPASGTFSPLPALASPRAGARALLLQDGRVALVGGRTAPGAEGVELYDPAQGGVPLPSPALGRASAEALPGGGFVVLGARERFADPTSSRATGSYFAPESLALAPRAPELSGVVFAGAADSVHPAGTIELRFSKPFELATLSASSVRVRDAQGRDLDCVLVADDARRRCFVTPRTALAPGTGYALEVEGL